MNVKQAYDLLNQAILPEVVGEESVTVEDVTGLVAYGKQIDAADAYDNYTKTIVNVIGKTVFVNRAYEGAFPNLLIDYTEFGSIVRKLSMDIPEAIETEDWLLENGQSYDPNIFYQPTITEKLFNKRTTFTVPISITERQVKESFHGESELVSFMSMIYSTIEKAMTIYIDSLCRRVISFMVCMNVAKGEGTPKAVNLLAMYNDEFNLTGNDALTADACLTNPEFIRFAVYKIQDYMNLMNTPTTVFNLDGKVRFTPKELMRVELLSKFSAAANAYLQSDTFHNEFTELPAADVVPYWQGSGTDNSFSECSKISLKDDDAFADETDHTVTVTGVLGIIWDRDAMAVTHYNKRVKTRENPVGDFINMWHKWDAQLMAALDENFCVFYVADET